MLGPPLAVMVPLPFRLPAFTITSPPAANSRPNTMAPSGPLYVADSSAAASPGLEKAPWAAAAWMVAYGLKRGSKLAVKAVDVGVLRRLTLGADPTVIGVPLTSTVRL